MLKDTQGMEEGCKSIDRIDVSELLGYLKIQKISGASPLDPIGGLRTPPNPQFLIDDADASSPNALRALIDARAHQGASRPISTLKAPRASHDLKPPLYTGW